MTRFLVYSIRFVCVAIAAHAAFANAAHANGILVRQSGREQTTGAPEPVRLTHHKVEVGIHDQLAQVTVEHTFHNDTDRQLEGRYLFPLPDGAVVSEFAMTMGGKMVKGEVIDAKQARAIYDAIVRRRKDPGLLEYMGRGLFQASVFPIPAHGDVRIRLKFQQVLPQTNGVAEFRYPLATDRLNGLPVENTVVDIHIEGTEDIKGVYSPSHDLSVTRSGERAAHIHLEQANRPQTKDLLLYVSRSAQAVGFSVLSHKGAGEDGTFMAVLAPRHHVPDAARVPKDVVFVLDTSGSMAGPQIQQAKAALAYGVRTLAEGDRFNVLAFATGVVPFRDGLIESTSDTQEAAVRWIDAQTTGGSTHISKALEDAFGMHDSKRLSIVVFLTDGHPTVGITDGTDLVAHAARTNTAKARVFTFGVGHDLDVRMLDRIAEQTRGARDYVAPGEDIEIVTERLFRKIRQPVMTNVLVDLGPDVYDVYPSELPDLFAGSQVVVYGRYKSPSHRVVRLTGDINGTQVSYESESHFTAKEDADFLPRLWGNRKVMYLLDQERLHGKTKEIRDEVIQLATRYAIVTPYTSGFVADEELVSSAAPLAHMGGGVPRRSGGGPGGQYRMPGGGPTPGLREPLDARPPPPPPTTPPATPPPSMPTPTPTDASQDLKRRKAASGEIDDENFRALRGRIVSVAGKTLTQRIDLRWIDTTYDGKQATVKIEAFSDAYFDLLAKDPKVAKYLAVGDRVVFVLGKVVYEIIPPASK